MSADLAVQEANPEMLSAFDMAELRMVESGLPQIEAPVEHTFANGFYIRQITMPKGFICTTRIHKFRHPFVVSKGVVEVWCEQDGHVVIEAPYTGITEPGTKRILFVHEECVWTTFHRTDKTTVDEAVADVTIPHENPFPEVEYVDAYGKIRNPELTEGEQS